MLNGRQRWEAIDSAIPRLNPNDSSVTSQFFLVGNTVTRLKGNLHPVQNPSLAFPRADVSALAFSSPLVLGVITRQDSCPLYSSAMNEILSCCANEQSETPIFPFLLQTKRHVNKSWRGREKWKRKIKQEIAERRTGGDGRCGRRNRGRQADRERDWTREGGRERSGIKGNKGRKETGSRSSRGGCIFRRKDTKWVISAREKFVKA